MYAPPDAWTWIPLPDTARRLTRTTAFAEGAGSVIVMPTVNGSAIMKSPAAAVASVLVTVRKFHALPLPAGP